MRWLAGAGVFLAFIGSALLYLFAVPSKNIGGTFIYGPLAMEVDSDEDGGTDWREEAGRLIDRSRRLSRLGFLLIAIGSLLELTAIIAT